jgi:hypothetical protein
MYGSKDDKGRVIYRCHRVEVDTTSNCGYWLAYEKDLLPFLYEHFLPDLRKEAAQYEERRKQAPPVDDEARLRRRSADLDRKIRRGEENFLGADPELAPGLHEVLKGWKSKRDALQRELSTARQAPVVGTLLDKLFRPLLATVHGGSEEIFPELQSHGAWEMPNSDPVLLIPCERPPWSAAILPASAVTVAEFREMLKRLGVTLSVWFRRKTKGKGYEIAKLRAQVSVTGLCGEYVAKATS